MQDQQPPSPIHRSQISVHHNNYIREKGKIDLSINEIK